MIRTTRFVAAALLAALTVAACSSSGGGQNNQSKTGAAGNPTVSGAVAGKKVTFIIYADQSTPFFNPVVKGAEDAAKLYGLNLNVEYSNSDAATQNNQINTAVASGVNALALSIPSNTAFTKSVCAASAKGIPVVAFNVNATSGPVLNCVLSFVGQDFPRAGDLIGQRLLKDTHLAHGAHVFCPVEDPTAVYATGRASGANQALASIGAKCDVVGTGFDLAKAQTTETQYLLGNTDTKAIIALGQVPLQVATAAEKSAGINVPIVGFDLSPEISNAIKSGTVLATVEQQPYLQGYYAIIQLALKLQYDLTPSNVDTGNAVIDKSNVDKISSLAGKVY